ncbi:protein kinase domain-containing protein [Butyrivibrio sp.]|uniref:protein kinase domain-containing protein n=1 Tax=Butyrivibrio sp. TaxID=28121 RepID=UPI0025C6DC2B|nr:protein kinase [Butyrivibrio sp.]
MAKVYKRKLAVRKDIESKLQRISSPYVANVVAAGEHGGYPVEIIPVYRHGSLKGRRFKYEELKNTIIPCLNEALFAIHQEGIIHKDIKPSNIMLNDNMRDVSVIDFGISSVTDEGVTVVVTNTSMTPEYSAPETFRGLFLSESDYYSLGITLYELYCGHTPFEGMSGDDIEQCITVKRLPYPADMPNDLVELISALTYYDITNRKNKDNPNRRWGYEEVKKWCNGIKQICPGEGIGTSPKGILAYKFNGQQYTDKTSLVDALACNWDKGKKELFRGILSSYYESTLPDFAEICKQAEASVEQGEDEDLVFFNAIYQLDDSCELIYWKGRKYQSIDDIGKELLFSLRFMNGAFCEEITDLLRNKVLSRYCSNIGVDSNDILTRLDEIENTIIANEEDAEIQNRLLYSVAYLLSGAKDFVCDDQTFNTIDQLAGYMCRLIDSSYDNYREFCDRLMNSRGVLDPQFDCWLISIGKQKETKMWKNRFQH